MSRPDAVPDPESDPAGAFREFRAYARGDLDSDHRDVHPIAGLVDDGDLREVLMFMAETYDRREVAETANEATRRRLAEESEEGLDPDDVTLDDDDRVDPLDLPTSFWRTELAQRAIRQEATDTAAEAIRQGEGHRVSFITGLPRYKADVSGLHAVDQLADWLVHSEDCKLIYLAALMGRGKTDLSVTFMQIVYRHYRRVDEATEEETPTPQFAANFEVETPLDDEVDGDGLVEHIDNYDDLLAWAEGGSSDEVRWFVFDEASTELTAQSGENAQRVAETLAPFVKKMRKLGVNMVVIGHDRGDVHVAIRSMADFVDKTGKKTATFYAGIKRREPTGELFSVSGIPPTEWSFNTDDMASWSWGSAVEDDEAVVEGMTEDELREERNERIARLYELTEATYEDLGTAFDVSRETVRRAVKSYDFEQKRAAV